MFYYKIRKSAWIMILLFAIALTGCGSDENATKDSGSSFSSVAPQDSKTESMSLESKSRISSSEDSSVNSSDPLPNSFNKTQMVYHAQLSIHVKDKKATLTEIEKNAKLAGAYLIQSQEQKYEETESATVTYRVPKDKFHTFLEDAKKLSQTSPSLSIQGDDVSEQLVDLESRLKAKQAMEQRLLDFMKHANQAADLLQIAKQLDTTQSELEQIKGRLQYLQNRVDYSTVEISLSQNAQIAPKDRPPLWSQMVDAFTTSIADLIVLLMDGIILLAGLIPFLLVLGVAFLLVRYIRKRRNKQRSKQLPKENDEDN